MLLGCLFNQPSLCIDGMYPLDKKEFNSNELQKIVYIVLLNLAKQGLKTATTLDVLEWLKKHPTQLEKFTKNNGVGYLEIISNLAKVENYDYYYKKFRKYSFLNDCLANNTNISHIYDENGDTKTQLINIDKLSMNDLINLADKESVDRKFRFQEKGSRQTYIAGTNFAKNKEKYKIAPMLGYSFHSPTLNEIHRGVYGFSLRVAKSSGGKTTTMIGDLLKSSALEYYDEIQKKFVKNKSYVGETLFINTEMTLEQLDNTFVAYISNVSRSKIADGSYEGDEEERVDYANEVLTRSPIYIEDMPDFDCHSLKNVIKYYVLNKNVKLVAFDYVQASGAVSAQIARDTRVPQQRDMILQELTNVLKQVQVDLKIHILSAVQTNGQEDRMEIPTEVCMAGGASQMRKTDACFAMLPPTKKELALVSSFVDEWNNQHSKEYGRKIVPNNVVHLFKGRNSAYPRYSRVYQHLDLGTGRTIDLFSTTKDLDYLKIPQRIIEIS